MKSIMLFTVILLGICNAQNFFPTRGGDAYQFRRLYTYREVTYVFVTVETFCSHSHSDSVYNGKTYTNIFIQTSNYTYSHYYRYDSTANKLFILLDGEEKLAVDFTRPSDAIDTLYFSGTPKEYKYTVTENENILGGLRKKIEIFCNDTVEHSWVTECFVSGIGYYSRLEIKNGGLSRYNKTVVSAKIDEQIVNQLTLDISPIMPTTIDRNNPSCIIDAQISAQYKGLVDSLWADVVVYKAGTVIHSQKFQGNAANEQINITLPNSIMQEANTVGFKVTCTDKSIFYNRVSVPQNGYKLVPVVGATPWSLLSTSISEPDPRAMKFFNSNYGFILGYRPYNSGNPPYVIKTETNNGGITFSSLTLPPIYIIPDKDIIRIDSVTGYMFLSGFVVAQEFVMKTTDGGHNWFSSSLNLQGDRRISCSFINKDYGWVFTTSSYYSNSKLFKTSNGGESWTNIYSPQTEIFASMSFVDENTGYALTSMGEIFKTIDSGDSWEHMCDSLADYKRLFMFGEGKGWVIGSTGISRTTDGGATWVEQKSGNFIDAHFFDNKHGWILGSPKSIFFTNNGGETWSDFNMPEVSGNYLFLDFIDPQQGWIYCSNGRFLKTTNGGLTFIEEDEVVEHELNQVNSYMLSQNYPNPFNPETTIRYSIPEKSRVVIKVFDVLGKEIKTVVDNELAEGAHQVKFNAGGLPSGVYFYRITAGKYSETKKMLITK